MNKAQLIETLAKENQLTKVMSERIINTVLDTIKKTLKKGDEVKISGFGRWYVAKRKFRKSRNPQTGEMIKIPSSRVPSFRCGRLFKEAFRS